jgi:hypothetical protein
MQEKRHSTEIKRTRCLKHKLVEDTSLFLLRRDFSSCLLLAVNLRANGSPYVQQPISINKQRLLFFKNSFTHKLPIILLLLKSASISLKEPRGATLIHMKYAKKTKIQLRKIANWQTIEVLNTAIHV